MTLDQQQSQQHSSVEKPGEKQLVRPAATAAAPMQKRVELDRLTTPQLIARLAQDAQNLVKAEIELGKSELRATVASGLTTLRRLAVGTLLALMAASLLVTGSVLALALVVPAWAAALIVAGGLGAASLTAFALARARHRRGNADGASST
jgi:hypothetical protein